MNLLDVVKWVILILLLGAFITAVAALFGTIAGTGSGLVPQLTAADQWSPTHPGFIRYILGFTQVNGGYSFWGLVVTFAGSAGAMFLTWMTYRIAKAILS